MDTYDVAILGGGPAGSTAAYRLARAGASVLLLDKARFPRDKPCGGGVTGRAARLLPFSIEPVVEDVADRLDAGLRYGQRVTRQARGPLAYMTQRLLLARLLDRLEVATDLGLMAPLALRNPPRPAIARRRMASRPGYVPQRSTKFPSVRAARFV